MRHCARFLLLLGLAVSARADWPEAREAFAKRYASTEAADRVKAARALTDFDHADGVGLLLECWRGEPDAEVRGALADAIARIADPEARAIVRDAVTKNPDPGVRARYCALYAAGRQPDRADVLAALLVDSSEVVRIRALRTLGNTDLTLLADAGGLLEDPSPEIRLAAAGALGAIGSIDAVPWLVDRLAVEKGEGLWAVQDALERLTAQKFGGDGAKWTAWWREHTSQESPEVKKAVDRGARWLREETRKALLGALWSGRPRTGKPLAQECAGLALQIHALIHAGLPGDDPVIQDGVLWLERAPLRTTYDVASMAMALADHGARAHAERLAEIGQWLVDTQCENGQWTYSGPGVGSKKDPVMTDAPAAAETGGTAAQAEVPRLRRRGAARQIQGDNSNTQYAVLGLRAALEVCEVPDETFERTLRFFTSARGVDGSWGYQSEDPGYGSMTAAGISSVQICLHALDRTDGLEPESLGKHKLLGAPVRWFVRHWSVKNNPGKGTFQYYYLYGLERAAMLSGLDRFGKHDWYREGCAWLLDRQQATGIWSEGLTPAQDTAFAILFLMRATKGLVGKPARRAPAPAPVPSGR